MGPPSEKGGINEAWADWAQSDFASMGPPSEKGGIVVCRSVLKNYGSVLQWGRPPRRAESLQIGCRTKCMIYASMGPPSEKGGIRITLLTSP